MTDRSHEIGSWLATAGYADWSHAPLTGDASNRHYVRLSNQSGETRILMDAPPQSAGSIEPFIRIATHLRGIGVRAPRIDAANPDLGLIVMEDFGDALFAVCVASGDLTQEVSLYEAAVDVLVHLQAHDPAPNLVQLDPTRGVALVREIQDWLPLQPDKIDPILAELAAALDRLTPSADVMALRDFHAENLVLCADGTGVWRTGVLDFQDAVLAHPVYDLVSLLRDIRRDVSDEAQSAAIARFATLTGTTADALGPALAIQGVQRNLRILGVFHRLAQRDGKTRYLEFVPRLMMLLAMDLSHPDLSSLRRAALPLLEGGTA